MAAHAPMAAALPPGRRSWMGFLFWLLLAGGAVALIASGAPLRDQSVELLERSGVAAAPGVRETALVIAQPEDAAAFAAESVLGRVAPASASPGEPIAIGPETPGLLSGVRMLALDGLAGAPGDAQHRVLLGRSAYAEWELVKEPKPEAARPWERTLILASKAAPGFPPAVEALAAAYLGGWPRLSAQERERGRAAISASFRSPSFVRRAFPAALSTLGPNESVRLLPRVRPALEAASSVLRAVGQGSLADQVSAAAAAAPGPPAAAPAS